MVKGTWGALHWTSAALTAVMGFMARTSARWADRFDAATGRLERLERWSRAKVQGVPLGADLAGEDWVEPSAVLPVVAVVKPPPLPPAALVKSRPTGSGDEDWGAAIVAAHKAIDPAESSSDDWSVALRAAKESAAPAATATPATAASPMPEAKPAERPVTPAPAPVTPVPSIAELRARLRPSAPMAISPHVDLKTGTTLVGLSGGPKLGPKRVDPDVAAAAKKAIAAALRS